MSIEEEARQKNKSFWEVNPELDDAEAAELARAGDADFQLEMQNAEDTSEDADATTTDGGDHTDVGDGQGHTDVGDDQGHTDVGGDQGHTDVGAGGNPKKTRKKSTKPRKDRTPQAVANVTATFTKVSLSGPPQEPRNIAKGYGMQLGCILRETVSINTYDLRSP